MRPEGGADQPPDDGPDPRAAFRDRLRETIGDDEPTIRRLARTTRETEADVRRVLGGRMVFTAAQVREILREWAVDGDPLSEPRDRTEEALDRLGPLPREPVPGSELVRWQPDFVSPSPWRRAWLRVRAGVPLRPVVLAVAAIVVVVAAVAVAVLLGDEGPSVASPPGAPAAPERCGATSIFATLNGSRECVGLVTDTDTMPPVLHAVLDSIRIENASIPADQPALTVAYVVPIPAATDPRSEETAARYARELDGVARAQRRADRTATLGGPVPPVRVLVYNTGTDGALWVRVLDDLEGRTGPDRIVAVAGLGSGLDSTGALAEALTGRRIPVFASRAVAAGLTALPIDPPGLFRTTSTSRDLAGTAGDRLRGDRDVALLQDERADNLDAIALGRDFAAALGGSAAAAIPYDSSLGPAGTDFSTRLAVRCPAGPTPTGPSAFFVAGRGPQIAEFLIALNYSACPGPVTVLAGPDGAQLLDQLRTGLRDPAPDPQAQQLITAFRNPKFRFLFLGLAHPDPWRTGLFDQRSIDTLASFPERGTPAEQDLQAGDQLVGYDAAIAAITCARRAGTQYEPLAAPMTVLETCPGTTSPTNPVYGAGGAVGFDPAGRIPARPVPLVEVLADGRAVVVGR